MQTDRSLTEISNQSLLPTCSCSTCTCSTQSSLKTTDDYVTFVFLTLYECFLWCLQMIYELFFKSFWEIVEYILQTYRIHERKSIQRRHRGSQNNNSHVILVSVHSSYCQTEPLVSINHETQKAEELCLPASQQKKVQRKRRTKMKLDKPFELSTTIHSDRTLNKIDYFLSKYIDQLYSDKHPLY